MLRIVLVVFFMLLSNTVLAKDQENKSHTENRKALELISLNVWGGHVEKPLLKFIEKHSDIDIFCLQEIYHNAPNKISMDNNTVDLNLFSKLQTLLPVHNGFFRSVVENSSYGLAIFVKKNINVIDTGNINIHSNIHYSGKGPTHSRDLQWIKLKINNKTYTIANMHGLWNGKGKTDTLERIAQSQKVRNFINSTNSLNILCGDFNIRPDTKSMSILDEQMQNLIKIHNINSTRTKLYPKKEKYADYILISPEFKVNTFKVLQDVVSDHSPLYINIQLP